MVKSNKKFEKKSKAKASAAQPAVVNSATNEILREQKILPITQGIQSASPTDRIQSLAAFSSIVRDETCRKLLLKERIVNVLLEKSIKDASQEVVVLAWGALRSLAKEEGYDVALHLYRKDVMVPAWAAIENIKTAIQNLLAAPTSMPKPEQALLWDCTDNIVGLIASLCETTEQVAISIGTTDMIMFLMGLLNPAAGAPEKVQATSAVCLYAVTEENETAINNLIDDKSNLDSLLQLKEATSPTELLRTIAIGGILHNVNVEQRLSGDKSEPPMFTSLEIAKSISKCYNVAVSNIQTQEDAHTCVHLALEVISSIASNADDVNDENEDEEAEPKRMNGDTMQDDDEDLIDIADGDDSDEEVEDERVDDLDAMMEHDMEMVTGDDGTLAKVRQSPLSLDSILGFLIEKIAPSILPLTTLNSPSNDSQTRLRAINTLNNIAWTVVMTLEKDSGGSGAKGSGSSGTLTITPPKSWKSLCERIWIDSVTPILATNIADAELAEALTSLSWAAAKSVNGELDVSHDQHKTFQGVYNAAESGEFKAKCVGLLGCLAMPQGRVEVNKEIGVFLITQLNLLPDISPEPVIEALNVLFDIYADKDYDYDQPNFVELGFLTHLQASATKVKTMTKKIDKRKHQTLRERADDAAANLTAFIRYKVNERKEVEKK